MALMTYLVRDKHGTYYFRRVVPVALRPFMPAPWTNKANWKTSLGTKLPAAAKRAVIRTLSKCDRDFELAEAAQRGGVLHTVTGSSHTAFSIEDIERDVFAALLAGDDSNRSDGDARRHLQTREERAQWPDLVPVSFGRKGMSEEDHHIYGEELEMLASDYRRALSRSDPGVVDAELRNFLRQSGIPIDNTSEDYRQAGLAVLRAHVRAYGLMLDRQRGEIVVTPALSVRDKGPKLSEAYEVWKAGSGARGGRQPTERTLMEAKHAVRRLTDWCGDVRLGALTREQVREFRDAMAKVPTRLPEPLRRLSLRELLKRDLKAYPPVHANTVNKSLNILAAIVSHAEAAGKLDAVQGFRSPFGKGAKLVVDARAEDPRQPFSPSDIAKIFSTPVYAIGARPRGGGGEAAFWLPLIAFFTGARQGELAQLRVEDLKPDPESGIWYFDISSEGGRSIKTVSSRRKVPMHPELERLGLLRYHDSLSSKPQAPLWPDLMSDTAGRRGGPWSKWFNRYLRVSAKIEDRGKVFHSFRHTFKRMARDAKLDEEVHDALTGHSGGGVGRSYGGGFGLGALLEAIGRLSVPDAVQGLTWEAQQVVILVY